MGLTSALSVLVILQVVTSSPTKDKHQVELKEHYDHLNYIADFMCHTPQPRVIPVHQLFSSAETWGKAYFPDVTVLHRCDDRAGCCTSGQRCGPVHSTQVNLPFKVTYLENIDGRKVGSWIIKYYTFTNHTECGCTAPASLMPTKDNHQFIEQLRVKCADYANTCAQLKEICDTLPEINDEHHPKPNDNHEHSLSPATPKTNFDAPLFSPSTTKDNSPSTSDNFGGLLAPSSTPIANFEELLGQSSQDQQTQSKDNNLEEMEEVCVEEPEGQTTTT